MFFHYTASCKIFKFQTPAICGYKYSTAHSINLLFKKILCQYSISHYELNYPKGILLQLYKYSREGWWYNSHSLINKYTPSVIVLSGIPPKCISASVYQYNCTPYTVILLKYIFSYLTKINSWQHH